MKTMTIRNKCKGVRTIMLLFVLLQAASCFGQQIQSFAFAGLSSGNYCAGNRGELFESNIGLLIGGGTDWMFHRHWGLKGVLELTGKGGDEIVLSSYREERFEIRNYYLELPIDVFYQGRLSKKWNLQLGAGFYLSYGLGGKMSSSNQSFNLYSSPMDFKRGDYGVHCMAQARKKWLFFSVCFEKGMIGVTNKFYDTGKAYNEVLAMACGMYF